MPYLNWCGRFHAGPLGDIASNPFTPVLAEHSLNAFSLFFQDAWQLTRKLRVNYGVRYDYFGLLYNHQKDLSIFVPAKGGLLFQGAGIPSLYPADWKNVAPRLGFAYRPRENGNLVVRGRIRNLL